MAGLGIQLNKIFDKHSVAAAIYGIGFSFVYTIAPMLVVIGCLFGMYRVLGFDTVGYLERETFSSSILYIFIFALLISSPFNSVLSKFQTDRIYERRYEDIQPCIYVGIITNLTLASLLAIPFYIYEIVVGGVPVYYVFTTYMGFLGLSLTFAAMVYNSILKQYKKISLYFISCMILSFLLSMVFRFLLGFSVTYSMLLALSIGFLLIASLELANVLRYFPGNSRRYREVLHYYRIYWKLIVSNFLYTLGLFIHNFVFWTQPWNLVVRNTYVSNQPYDMASCLAMFTSISASVLFISRVEMHFHERYRDYTDAVIGGKLDSIESSKKRMFRGLSSQLFSLVNIQFVVTVLLYLIAIIALPLMGFSGMVMAIYPQLAVGYFISYLMYSEMLFLYYFDDLTGAMINGIIYAGVALVGSILATKLAVIWYGAGFTAAAFLAFTFSYFRLRWIERNLDSHIFCRGTVLKQISEDMPEADVYNIYKGRTTIR
ncbi:putative membrane protein [Anaerotaenia torta]|uniref:exopolysaccharide Pel transporter PelG n=1 Tax=Anaerotaenia torta TaxID=433293 RepID=UPI003D1E174F